LCFEAGDQKRRLAPIPSGWQFRDKSVLEQLCAEATPVPARRTTERREHGLTTGGSYIA
jgi:hypothetical protein